MGGRAGSARLPIQRALVVPAPRRLSFTCSSPHSSATSLRVATDRRASTVGGPAVQVGRHNTGTSPARSLLSLANSILQTTGVHSCPLQAPRKATPTTAAPLPACAAASWRFPFSAGALLLLLLCCQCAHGSETPDEVSPETAGLDAGAVSNCVVKPPRSHRHPGMQLPAGRSAQLSPAWKLSIGLAGCGGCMPPNMPSCCCTQAVHTVRRQLAAAAKSGNLAVVFKHSSKTVAAEAYGRYLVALQHKVCTGETSNRGLPVKLYVHMNSRADTCAIIQGCRTPRRCCCCGRFGWIGVASKLAGLSLWVLRALPRYSAKWPRLVLYSRCIDSLIEH